MKLINLETKEDVNLGDEIVSFRDEKYILESMTAPHKPSSGGKVYARPVDGGMRRELYPSVFGLKFVDTNYSELDNLLKSDKVIISVVGR